MTKKRTNATTTKNPIAVVFRQNRSAEKRRLERLRLARQIRKHSHIDWLALVAVCGYKCVKCGERERIQKDHVLPLYRGGDDSIDNVQPLCMRCNVRKGIDVTDYRPEVWREEIRYVTVCPYRLRCLEHAPVDMGFRLMTFDAAVDFLSRFGKVEVRVLP